MLELVMKSHANMTTDEFAAIAKEWLDTARHPRFNRRYDELVFQPMLELLAYLRANEFKTFINSGGGIEFLRVFAEQAYGIPPEQVIGSSSKTKFELRDGKPVLVRLLKIDFIDDHEGKPIGINSHIGRRPIASLAIPMATCRCCNGRLPETEPDFACWFTIPMPSANGLMIATLRSATWTRPSLKRINAAGASSI